MPEPTPSDKSRHPAIALGLLGGALVGRSRGQGRPGRLLAAAGIGLVAWAARPLFRDWLVRRGTARRRVTLSVSLDVQRPVHEVFAFCKDFENFPKIFGSLHSVIDYQDGRSHWEAFSASGRVVAWDAVVTKYVPNSVIAWSSVPRSEVETKGLIRFVAKGAAATQLTIDLSYRPRETRFNDALHALAVPRREDQVRADLARAAFYIESLPRLEVVADAPSPPAEAETADTSAGA
jgi:uncharacterized membrane protein